MLTCLLVTSLHSKPVGTRSTRRSRGRMSGASAMLTLKTDFNKFIFSRGEEGCLQGFGWLECLGIKWFLRLVRLNSNNYRMSREESLLLRCEYDSAISFLMPLACHSSH